MRRALSIQITLLIAVLALGFAGVAAAQVQTGPTQPSPQPQPAGIVIPAGDDGWRTKGGGGTIAEFDGVTIPGACGISDGNLDQDVVLKGKPLKSDDAVAMNDIDTIVRRLNGTPALRVGDTSRVNIQIQGLRLVSTSPAVVDCPDGSSVSYNVSAHLSSLGQSVGFMDITRNHADGGRFDSELFVTPKFYFRPVGGGAAIELDCGDAAIDCGVEEELHFASTGTPWTAAGGPGGYDPGANGINTVPPSVSFDSDGDGSLDTLTIGASNFTAGINPVDWTLWILREIEILNSPEHQAEPDDEEDDPDFEPVDPVPHEEEEETETETEPGTGGTVEP